MIERFQILLKFLERCDAEVQGRELSEPTEEVKAKLQRFARGSVSEPEQADIFCLLDQHPEWIGWLAQEVKGLRRGNA
jgi:hypothetical protein